ncbi:hypothetical protein IMG5_148340 [Ichthyophthirius multifiliis]|uniref:Transmembrane protein n=1 Tax=Ichthyophthirius multifiliis TaxID=5932 RepID=G0QYA2_ICHMU|nr:hypothetical protein IMG5_148340 [Ichthyophthirius multifiliis]EGR29806.1 hypothetical protein IMG5_148340 [Ichthyophthirius multifiliis]|eukprot:XP_004031042.1 hypothetical protein IMG5_148340 [Ichthyophthirius multifiliis]
MCQLFLVKIIIIYLCVHFHWYNCYILTYFVYYIIQQEVFYYYQQFNFLFWQFEEIHFGYILIFSYLQNCILLIKDFLNDCYCKHLFQSNISCAAKRYFIKS